MAILVCLNSLYNVVTLSQRGKNILETKTLYWNICEEVHFLVKFQPELLNFDWGLLTYLERLRVEC